MKTRMALLAAALLAGPLPAQVPEQMPAPSVERVVAPSAGSPLEPLPTVVVGRVDGERRQWPGTYYETALDGTAALFRVGPGEVSLRVSVDGGAPVPLVRPAPGLYRVAGLSPGPHALRVDVASESQAGPTAFGGFLASPGTAALPLPRRARQIEFIGDSHTVGYGNISARTECSEAEVWATTDTSQGVAPRTADRYDADYQVNAISGRGVVRNYNGFAADTLPQAYPYALLDHMARAGNPRWAPQVVVIALGTNDFSTPLRPGERWATRDALHADFEERYVAFVRDLRRRQPQAHVVLWATDAVSGEIAGEVARVHERLRLTGETRIGFVLVGGLAFTGCHAHPGLADDQRIAGALIGYLDGHPEVWRQ